MLQDDLNKIEKELGIKLPNGYKEVMLNYPFSSTQYSNVQESLSDNPENLINLNLFYREHGYKGKVFPEYFFIIGTTGNNGIYFIDLRRDDETIYSIDNDTKYNPKSIQKEKLRGNFDGFIKLKKVLQNILNNP